MVIVSFYISNLVRVARDIKMNEGLQEKFLKSWKVLVSFEEIICFLVWDSKDCALHHFFLYESFTARRGEVG